MAEASCHGAAPAHLWSALSAGSAAVVLGAVPAACFLRLTGARPDTSEILAILSADASLLPFGIRTDVPASTAPWRHLRPGTEGAVGRHTVRLPGVEVAIGRWWRPATVRRRAGRPGGDRELRSGLASLVAALPAHADAPLLPPYGDDPHHADPHRLLGLGPGLTPYGDDVLAGRLLAAAAWGGERDRKVLAEAVLTAAPGRTTGVSVACLREAAAGRCVPEAARLVDAMGDPAGGSAGVARALSALLRVGHTSGHGLAVGLRDGATAALAARAVCA